MADADAAEGAVLQLGARLLQGESGTGSRVFVDPAGHPFCLVYRGSTTRSVHV